MIRTIFFDLDGTLLQMDQDAFLKSYFESLGKFMSQYIKDIPTFMKAMMKSVDQMLHHDGSQNNETVFWRHMETHIPGIKSLEPTFEQYYQTVFKTLRGNTQVHPKVREIIKSLKTKGYQLCLTTNPVFPAIATEERIRWSGLAPTDFMYITTYENSSYTKPKLAYFKEVEQKFQFVASEILVVGNDTADDMSQILEEYDTFLITDCLIDKEHLPRPKKEGTMEEFYRYVLNLPNITK